MSLSKWWKDVDITFDPPYDDDFAVLFRMYGRRVPVVVLEKVSGVHLLIHLHETKLFLQAGSARHNLPFPVGF